MRAKNLLGKRYGKLEVIESFGAMKGKGRVWKCKCDCGNIIELTTSKLEAGYNKSCGCAVIRYKESLGTAKVIYRKYKIHAKNANREFSIAFDDFIRLTRQDCYYCGTEPKLIQTNSVGNKPYTYNGIDRIDNTKGYSIDNVITCCRTCNFMKGSLDQSEFIKQTLLIAERHDRDDLRCDYCRIGTKRDQ